MRMGHRQIDIDTDDAGKCVNGSIHAFHSFGEERLSNFDGAGTGRRRGGEERGERRHR